MDAATVASIVALVIACIALLIAFAQVIQQYLQTGQLIRLCDSVVFGPMPGQGRRVWVTSQFRFRIVYSVPQISIAPHLWPHWPPYIGSFATGKHSLTDINFRSSKKRDTKEDRLRYDDYYSMNDASNAVSLGEASWVSFSRVAQKSCGLSIRYDLVEYDADRCPSDLPNVPMQASMRDVVVMATFAGMECVQADFASRSLSMQGAAGSIVSSAHPTLGPIIRFIPRPQKPQLSPRFSFLEGPFGSSIQSCWIERMVDYCRVAGDINYFRIRRRTTQRREGTWRRYTTFNRSRSTNHSFDGAGPTSEVVVPEFRSRSNSRRRSEISPKDNSSTEKKDVEVKTALTPAMKEAVTPEKSNYVPKRGVRDGNWVTSELDLSRLQERPKQTERPALREAQDTLPARRRRKGTRIKTTPSSRQDAQDTIDFPRCTKDAIANTMQPRVEDVPDEDEDEDVGTSFFRQRAKYAQQKQKERRDQMMKIEARDEKSRKERSRVQKRHLDYKHPLLLTYPGYGDQTSHATEPPTVPKSEAATDEESEGESETERLEQERAAKRRARDDERHARLRQHGQAVQFGDVDWFWVSQTDIFEGIWATPWLGGLDRGTVRGGAAVFVEALLGIFDPECFLYIKPGEYRSPLSHSIRQTYVWMKHGSYTCPSYALNSLGGVIPDGTMFLVDIPCFHSKVPAIELLYSYDWQCNDVYQDFSIHGGLLNVELMRLDAWLSYVGRLTEISDGRSKLLKQAPALVSKLIQEFELDFIQLEESATEGGFQDIQSLAGSVMDFLMDERLTEAEQVFILMAALRTIKVARRIHDGPDTRHLGDILSKDVQVHLV